MVMIFYHLDVEVRVDYSNDDYDTTGMGKRCKVVQQRSIHKFMAPEKEVAIRCDDGSRLRHVTSLLTSDSDP